MTLDYADGALKSIKQMSDLLSNALRQKSPVTVVSAFDLSADCYIAIYAPVGMRLFHESWL